MATTPTPNDPANPIAPKTPASTFRLTDGWYVFGYCIFMVMVADTRIGPVVGGIGVLALLYQTTLLIQGK